MDHQGSSRVLSCNSGSFCKTNQELLSKPARETDFQLERRMGGVWGGTLAVTAGNFSIRKCTSVSGSLSSQGQSNQKPGSSPSLPGGSFCESRLPDFLTLLFPFLPSASPTGLLHTVRSLPFLLRPSLSFSSCILPTVPRCSLFPLAYSFQN